MVVQTISFNTIQTLVPHHVQTVNMKIQQVSDVFFVLLSVLHAHHHQQTALHVECQLLQQIYTSIQINV